jgi:hypothetical protein
MFGKMQTSIFCPIMNFIDICKRRQQGTKEAMKPMAQIN